MSLEVFVLGTSGMLPLPDRHLTSTIIRRNGQLFLFDCGEGTQVALKKINMHWKKIDYIFISHMHADHVTGLPGLLMLSSQVDRDKPLYIYGPEILNEYINSNRKLLDMFINYEIIFKPVKLGVNLETEEFIINSVPLLHTKPCYGFILREKDRVGEFKVDRAEELGIPKGPLWGKLQKGETINYNGKTFKPEQVLGEKRKGNSFAYITDTMYLSSISNYVKDVDILICEGMFTKDLSEDAYEKKHMTSSQAAKIALDAGAKKLYLTHYSPRYSSYELKKLLNEAREIFTETYLAEDGMYIRIENND